MVLTKQLQEEDRQLQSIRECQFLLSRPVHEDVGEKHIVEICLDYRVMCPVKNKDSVFRKLQDVFSFMFTLLRARGRPHRVLNIYLSLFLSLSLSLHKYLHYNLICLSKSMYFLELAVLALARIMCANIHSQNGTAILAQELLSRK